MAAALLARAFAVLERVPAWVWLVLGLAAWGAWGHAHSQALKAKAAAQQHQLDVQRHQIDTLDRFREAEHQADATQREISDALHAAQARRARDTAAVAERLRNRAAAARAAMPASAGAARGRDDAPAVALIRDETRADLVQQADDADAVAARLASLQRYVREVCRPALR